jgi:hypothetical protein
MNKKVKAVVDGFNRLADEERTRAYLEIEAIWKAPPADEPNRVPSGFSAKGRLSRPSSVERHGQ